MEGDVQFQGQRPGRPGRGSEPEKRHRVALQVHRLQPDRGPAAQAWDGVISQHHQAVEVSGQRRNDQPPRLGLDVGPAPNRRPAEPLDTADQQDAIIVENLNQVGIPTAEDACPAAPADDGLRPIQPCVPLEVGPIPIGHPEQRPRRTG